MASPRSTLEGAVFRCRFVATGPTGMRCDTVRITRQLSAALSPLGVIGSTAYLTASTLLSARAS